MFFKKRSFNFNENKYQWKSYNLIKLSSKQMSTDIWWGFVARWFYFSKENCQHIQGYPCDVTGQGERSLIFLSTEKVHLMITFSTFSNEIKTNDWNCTNWNCTSLLHGIRRFSFNFASYVIVEYGVTVCPFISYIMMKIYWV